MPGVVDSHVGYTGGTAADPTYASVCGGDGHTEALRLTYDPAVTSYEALVTFFFEDPHVRDVYPDAPAPKAQYKTAVFAQDDAQAKVARDASHEVGKSVPILPCTRWYNAEEWHQHFLLEFKDFPDDE